MTLAVLTVGWHAITKVLGLHVNVSPRSLSESLRAHMAFAISVSNVVYPDPCIIQFGYNKMNNQIANIHRFASMKMSYAWFKCDVGCFIVVMCRFVCGVSTW